ncbi:Uncharacterised protein [Mycobacteroides abscessus subsp. abscessus]|jgi:hypothetical protein|nr:Uncharacterised protein [Mycobacteroides abscessus subsp. abscessus]SKL77391.1 Uncharacterised protein [Mycobacteroides abscessus subsp. abscessus]SKM55377.1 Uncharacterised protein [Mycobacteroides abscessus subsp. abscessus]SLK36117.1 Uncharacterised protein [Mycobacteroides abscessus subsp. abscessus]
MIATYFMVLGAFPVAAIFCAGVTMSLKWWAQHHPITHE